MSTKTLRKRIALVAVSALGFGVMSAVPSVAANAFTASFTAPSTAVIQTIGGTAVARDLGTIQVNLTAGPGDTFVVGTDTATVTIAAPTGATQAATDANTAFLGRLSISSQQTIVGTGSPAVVASASNDTNFATTGLNALNNATVSTTTTTMLTSPTSASFTTAVGRAYLKMSALDAAQATAANGGVVTLTMTVTSNGKISTFTQTITATILPRIPGTATTVTTTGTINAGGTATFVYTSPYTAVVANDVWQERTLTLGGVAGATFTATAVATGGAITLTRTDANNIVATAVKSTIAGAYSVTYTIVVTAPATAGPGSIISVTPGWQVTVQPYTPAYNSSAVTESTGTNGYYVSPADGGDGFVYAAAAKKDASVLTVAVQQKDQNGANISVAAYARTVNATITGKGSLAQVLSNGQDVVVKSLTDSVVNGNLSGNDSFSVWSDGTSGEGTLTITVGGATVATYALRFYGDAATITATLLLPIGNMSGAISGTEGAAGANTTTAARTNTLAGGTDTKDVGSLTSPAVAVVVKDANGWAIPTAAPLATSSNLAVVSGSARLFIDSGVSNPALLKYSAGTFAQHYSYTTLPSASGSSSNLTYTFVNAAGTALTTTAVKVSVGGAIAKGALAFDKATYDPGTVATLTATATDAAGNKPFDGQDLMNNGCESTLNFTCPTSFKLVDGTKSRVVFAPIASGKWTVTILDSADRASTATATIRNAADEANAAIAALKAQLDAAAIKAAADKASTDAAIAAAQAAAVAASKAAEEAATASADAAAEATDAANAATDAANASAEAGDAATAAAQDAADAVAALSTQVSEMIDTLKKQITALTNLVIKIQKKVRA
jgi:hypothetical protein